MDFQIKDFATLRMVVSDVIQSSDWYRRFFGIEPVEEIENFASFKIGSTCLDICKADEKSPLSLGGSTGYWLVDDLDKAILHAASLGGTIHRGPLRVDETKRTIVQICDPYGNIIGLECEC